MTKKIVFFIGLGFLFSCGKTSVNPKTPTPYELMLPNRFPSPTIPENNPLTEEGVQLGRMLFYDNILSGDNTQSCSSCHSQETGFSDENRFSIGIDGKKGIRNSPTLINVMWTSPFFWDGRTETLELQAIEPVKDPIEMHQKWVDALSKLQKSENYPSLFNAAFQTENITTELVTKAIAQFERTLISANAKFDRPQEFNDQEKRGELIFFTEKGDCFHCHSSRLLTDNKFHNNGLDANFSDLGRGKVTGIANDNGKFKTPTLRNIAFSAPYMHDGRFQTLKEVIDFYSEEIQFSETIDPLMKNVHQGGIQLSEQEKEDLIAFLNTFSDIEFLNNPDFSSPF